VTAQRIELSSEGFNLQVDVDENGRITVAAITRHGITDDRGDAAVESVDVTAPVREG
jgi:hypothetical protein